VAESPGAADLPPDQLLDALWAEQRQGWLRGNGVPAQVYLQRYPDLAADPERAADLIYHEFIVREEAGAAPPFEEYLRDHAPYASQLKDLYEADQEIKSRQAAVDRLGDYELLEEVGRGGMGVVYRARQVSLDRIVAVKRLLAGALASPEDVQRFLQEAEAAGRLQHPNIVAVHEAGVHSGQPYFSMDFVEGTSLAAVVRDNPLPAARAAGYVRTLAEAIHYAHGQGLLHRDLKPSNVLIDKDDRPRITDFGLAKRTAGGPQLTATGAVLGTPGYASPEQVDGKRGPVSPASDVYALGAILYELLTGRPPFQAETPIDTFLLALEREPVEPRRLNPKVPRDLETVCLKCLQKEPHKRYASARDLADDLGRFLKREPVQARRVGLLERQWRWCRRNPVVAGSLAAVLLALLTGTAVSAYFAVQTRQEAETARNERDKVQREKNRADENLKIARDSIYEAITQTSQNKRLLKHDLEGLRKELLLSAVQTYQKLVQLQEDDEKTQSEQGRALGRLAKITFDIDSPDEAAKLLVLAQDLFARLAQRDPSNPAHQVDVAKTFQHLEIVYRVMGQMDKAEEASRQAVEAWSNLCYAHPPGYQGELAGAYLNRGTLCSETGRLDEAEKAYRKSVETYERLAREPADLEGQSNLAMAYNSLGAFYHETRRFPLALELFQKALPIRQRLAREHPSELDYQTDLAVSHYNLGNLHSEMGLPDKAEEAYREALRIQEPLAAAHRQVAEYRGAVAGTLNNLGNLYRSTGRRPLAEQTYLRALNLWEELVRGQPSRKDSAIGFGESACGLGELSSSSDDSPVALAWFAKAIAALETQLRQGNSDPLARSQLRLTCTGRAQLLGRVGRHAEALPDWDRAIALADAKEGVSLRLARALCRACAGQHTGAAAEANEAAGQAPSVGDVLYQAARVHARCSAVVSADTHLPQVERNQLAERYTSRAMELLTQAGAAGYFHDSARHNALGKDADLEPLRSRQDFNTWLRGLQEKVQTPAR
jgi:serine/threonine protein kinase